MNFSKKAGAGDKNTIEKDSRGFPRDTSDNPYFKDIQVTDIQDIVTEDCEFWWDFDTAIFQACSVQDDNYIKVIRKHDKHEEIFKNRTEWKGRLKKEGAISDTSKLGLTNIKRVAEGLEPYCLEDFEVEDIKVLKDGCGLDNVKSKIKDLIESVKFQFNILPTQKLKLQLGKGDAFRSLLPLPEPYKGNRDKQSRPTLLKKGREWLVEEMGAEVFEAHGTENCLEADDVCSIAGQEGYQNFLKTNKFHKVQIGFDKDDWQGCCLYINYHLKGVKFKMPQAFLVQNTQRGGVGTLEMNGDDCKCSGLLQVAFQMCTGDSSDHYHPYLRFEKSVQPKGSYADISFYKDFLTLDTPQKVLQKVVDKYEEWFPKGLRYIDHSGKDIHCDTMTWLNVIFLCVYMKRSYDDNLDFYKMCKVFKVDTSKVIDNHIEKKLPLASEENIRNTFEEVSTALESLQEVLSDTKGTKSALIERMEEVKLELSHLHETLWVGLFDEPVQEEKQ